MYLTVTEYAKKEKISRQSAYNRIKKGYISKERIRKNDSGAIEIQFAPTAEGIATADLELVFSAQSSVLRTDYLKGNGVN